ncbi:hypothetical protein G6F53_013325 [Rhizopus delemar]|uniref:Integrase catalytic domain-containing protein n=1 Tax=Rhizopus oryzae TaxID=64495 RepID=A0A9P6XSE9_RHIOR|nr:hypothetical protein G6F53_013325 [Rhizopus delemar]KAG1494187.1 hypothetical protein G6F52_013163 [Rhizopus delemar]KAG1531251.1 hypothetical protein G6F51_013580 [Rhizopus arrhizus]
MIKYSGIEHRLSNPYNPLGNSVNERYVGLAKQIIVKRLDGVKNEWDLYLPSVQQPNELIDYSNIQPILHNQTIDPQVLEDKLKDVMDIIIPGLREKISETQRNDNTKFMRKNRIIHDQYPLKSEVMIKNVNRTDKTSERYEGPYTIHGYTKNGSYILMDKTGALLPRNIPTSHIVLISSDNVEPDPNDKQWELQAIVDHRQVKILGNLVTVSKVMFLS